MLPLDSVGRDVRYRTKELLDGASEQVGTDIAEDRRVGMEGGLHLGAAARLAAVDIAPDQLSQAGSRTHCGLSDEIFSECQLGLSPSRQAITSSSPRTASSTVMTGRASNTKAGSIEQNL
jgi:hypothetical protein